MVKIIPPKSWKPRLSPYQQSLSSLQIKNPIEQNAEGKTGVYQFKHITLPSMSYQSFVDKYQSRQEVTRGKSSQQIQNLFWKTLAFSSPVYGADLLGSLMQSSAGQWNLNSLNTILQKGLQQNIKGVNTAYCYIGSWKALFCWHKQDLDLQAINYLHYGKSKFWYCIQTDDSHILEKQAKRNFFKGFDCCQQYLRHKTSLINPYSLKRSNPSLRISKIEQRAGEFIIAFSGAYHCGFNFGINVAQAVNYGTLDWLPKLKAASYCTCKKSSVKMSLSAVLQNLLKTEQYKNNIMVNELLKQAMLNQTNCLIQQGQEIKKDDPEDQNNMILQNKTKKIYKLKQEGIKNKGKVKIGKKLTSKLKQVKNQKLRGQQSFINEQIIQENILKQVEVPQQGSIVAQVANSKTSGCFQQMNFQQGLNQQIFDILYDIQ